MNKLIGIVGPTASGKTSLAVSLAQKINGEIISADSRQVYRQMDIGSGKDIKEYKNIPYHLIDIVNPGYEYNVFEYQKDFLTAYKKVVANNKIPILCGGSGLYIEAVLKGYKLLNVPPNPDFRKTLEDKTDEELTEILKSYKNTHNTTDTLYRKRLLRAIEIEEYLLKHDDFDFKYPTFDYKLFTIDFDRKILRKRITKRLKERFDEGMIDEVKNLLDEGISAEKLIYYGLEYKFIAQYITGEIKSFNDLFQKLNSAISQFSKRQGTWFRRMEKNGFKITKIPSHLSTEKMLNIILKEIND